ncbi:MAG: hypothetical protein J0L92_03600 [Deltaproteobacteria bacterium]|nr:hypothetical protein [Deltaproteobacteria bacterium]
MPTPITGLPGELTTLADNDLLVVDDTSEVETKKITVANLRNAIGGGFGYASPGDEIDLPDRNFILDAQDSFPANLPPCSEGRVYLVRIVADGGDYAVTLVPDAGAGDEIDGSTDAKVLTGEVGATWLVTGGGAYGWRTSRLSTRVHTAAVQPSNEDDAGTGFPVGTIWVLTVDDITTDVYVSIVDVDDEAIWRRLGTGDGTTDGWSMQTSTATTVNVVTPFPMGGLILRLGLTGNTTVNLPYGNGGEVLLITVSNSGHSTVTLHPFSGTTVQYGTADYRLPNVRVYTPGPTATQPTISYLLIHNGSTWVLVAPAVPTQGAIPNGYAVPMVPDCDVCLLNSGGGNVSYPMPAVVVGVPHLLLLKKTSTDTYTTTFTPSGAELIEGSNSAFLLPGSAATDRPSWTWYRDLDGNWWLL